MREIFEALEEAHKKRPEMDRNEAWYPNHLHEEADELLATVGESDNTNKLKEGADVIALVVDFWRIAKISPEVAKQAILDKIQEISDRPAEYFTLKPVAVTHDIVNFDYIGDE